MTTGAGRAGGVPGPGLQGTAQSPEEARHTLCQQTAEPSSADTLILDFQLLEP